MENQSLENENDQLSSLLKKNKLWEKKSAFEHKSLLKALSNAIYLTKTAHEHLQKKLLAFFLANVKYFAKEFAFQDFECIRNFVRDFNLPQYQDNLLLICAKLLKRQIMLYYFEADNLRIEFFGPQVQPPLRLIRLYDSHYSALFPLEYKIKFAIAQNIVLNLVEHALSEQKPEFKLTNHNSDEFENYEYKDWLENSMSNENLLTNTTSPDNRLQSSPSLYKFLFKSDSSGADLGSKIVNLFQQRKRKLSYSSSTENHFQFETDCEKLLMNLEKAAGKKNKRLFLKNNNDKITQTLNPSLVEASDTFSFRDVEHLLWYKNEPDTKYNNFEDNPENSPIRIRPKGQSFSTSSFSANHFPGRPVFPDTKPNYANHQIGLNLAQIRYIDAEDDESASTALSQYFSNALFPINIKPSFSENSVQRIPRTEFQNFSCPFIQPFPPSEDLKDTDKEIQTKTQQKKKKKNPNSESKTYRGALKFFDEKNNFGFLSTPISGKLEDVFVYRSEFDQAGIEMSTVRMAKHGTVLTFEFNLAFYFGKYQRSKKALNLKLVEVTRLPEE